MNEIDERPEHEEFGPSGEESETYDPELSEADGEIGVNIAVEVAKCDECGAYAADRLINP